MAQDVLATARDLADQVLFPNAMRVDRLDVLPAAYLDALAAAGLYGAPAPAEAGGLGLDLRQVSGVVEELASGCLAAAFVLIQHFRLVGTLAGGTAPPQLKDRWLGPACRGRVRGRPRAHRPHPGAAAAARRAGRRWLAAGRDGAVGDRLGADRPGPGDGPRTG